MTSPQNFSARVISNEYIAKETRKTIFEIQDKSFLFKTGQFVNLKVEPKIMRAYSVASSSSMLPLFELCVKVIENGKGSGYIDRMKEGDIVEFMGPFGHFGRKDYSKKILLLGTGTGIAPLKAILDDEKDKGFQVSVDLVFGVRSLEFASYHSYFKTLASENKNFQYNLCISRNEETENYKGRVTDWLKDQSNDFFENREIIICGNPSMIKEAKDILLNKFLISKEQLIIEAF